MGWTYGPKPNNITEWFKDHLTWENDKQKVTCLKTAIKFKEAYAAVETINKTTGQRYVWAAVFMLNYTREAYYNFGYKDMDESMGPNISNCPISILNLLTPVEEHPISYESRQWAAAWRERCRKNASKKPIKFGDTVEFEEPLSNGATIFKKIRYGRSRNIFESDKGLIRLPKWVFNTYKYKHLTA